MRQERQKVPFQRRLNGGQFRFWQFAAEGDVEAEILHHIGVAPADQVVLLRRSQPGSATLGEFSLARRGAKRVKIPHTGTRQSVESGLVTRDAQGQEAAQPGKMQALHRHRSLAGSECATGLFQVVQTSSRRKPHRRFNRSMQPVFARHSSDRRQIQTGNVGLFTGTAWLHVPPQPSGCKAAPFGLCRGSKINRVSRECHIGLLYVAVPIARKL